MLLGTSRDELDVEYVQLRRLLKAGANRDAAKE